MKEQPKELCPIEDKLILRSATETVSTGGVIIPDLAQENTMVADVIKVGPGRMKDDGTRVPMSCQVGDSVVFPKFSAHRFEFNDEEYIVIRESDIYTRIGVVATTEKSKKSILRG